MANKSIKCTGWCGPTIIYAILATISTVLSFIHPDLKSHHERGVVLLANIINGLFWTGLLYFLCKNCWYNAAWVILLIPFMLAFLMLLFVTSIALAFIRSGGQFHPAQAQAMGHSQSREHMANLQDSYADQFAHVPGSKFPDQILDLQSQRASPPAPTHAKSVCSYAARPSKFNVLTRQQLQSPGTYMIPPGGINPSTNSSNMPDGCHEGYPPNPIIKYAMPGEHLASTPN